MNNSLLTHLGIELPIIQAPMAGGATTPQLVAGVSNCGGLGSIGAGYLEPEILRKAIRETKELTTHAFNINIFVPNECAVNDRQMDQACDAINACSKELYVHNKAVSAPYSVNFNDQLSVILEEKVPVVSFMFGLPEQSIIDAVKARGSIVIATATTLAEAVFCEERGVGAVVAQGSEAGGHRGSFLKAEEVSLVDTGLSH